MYRLFTIALLLMSTGWQAPAQRVSLPLWPNGTPEPWKPAGDERDTTTAKDDLVAGRPVSRITAIREPTLAVYSPKASASATAAALVFPGGGYRILAYDLEGSEVCDWLNSIGMTCVLVKYRVPVDGRYPASTVDLEDAQQAMRLTRSHAAEWNIDPRRIGVIGFSAGGHLAAVLSDHPNEKLAGVEQSSVDARPDFAMIIYPGYLRDEANHMKLSPGVEPNSHTPPTFLVQAEDDPVHEENALVYFQALKEANVPAELHLFAQGGHGYGLRPTELPVTHWPSYAETWLHTIHVLGQPAKMP